MAARSLGTLTLDLIAKIGGFEAGMDRASRNARKNMGAISAATVAAGNLIAEVVSNAVSALGDLVTETTTAGAEISRLASVSGISTDQFQRFAVGARFAGIEQDKLADIFKDTNDRIGDFLQTGGGPLLDFFEQIAPRVGVTAEQFANLSGPQALQLYVSSLEKANVSQNEMTFFLEAVASDLTLLLPLLRNNGEGFRELGDQAEAAGAILSQDTIRASSELTAAFKLAGLAVDGIKNQIAADLLPVLSDLSNEFFNVSENADLASNISDFLESSLKNITAVAIGTVTAFDLLGTSLGAIAAAVATRSLDPLREGFIDVESAAQDAATAINKIFEAGSGGAPGSEANTRIQTLVDLMQQSREAIAGAGEVLTKTQRDAFVEIIKTIEGLQLQAVRVTFN